MIRQFKVEGFKSLQEAEIELGTVNVFIGANGSGKSNLLEALGVMGAAAARSVEPEALRYRGVRPGLPTLYKTAFATKQGTRRRITRLIKLFASNESADYKVCLDNPVEETRRPWGIHSETLHGSGDVVLLSRSPRGFNVPGVVERPAESIRREETFARQAVTLQPDAGADDLLARLAEYAIFTPSTPTLRGIDEDISRPPLGLGGSGLPSAINDILAAGSSRDFGPFATDEIFELIDWADQVSIVPTQRTSMSPAVSAGSYSVKFRDRYMKRGRDSLSGYDASEGALYVLFLLSLACHPDAPRTFAIDNFDHALHPRLAASLTRLVCDGLLEQRDRQMVLTTHNPLVLDGLDLSDDEIRLFAVERVIRPAEARDLDVPVGATRIRRIKPKGKLLEAHEDTSLSRLWIMGRLGAVPRLI